MGSVASTFDDLPQGRVLVITPRACVSDHVVYVHGEYLLIVDGGEWRRLHRAHVGTLLPAHVDTSPRAARAAQRAHERLLVASVGALREI